MYVLCVFPVAVEGKSWINMSPKSIAGALITIYIVKSDHAHPSSAREHNNTAYN